MAPWGTHTVERSGRQGAPPPPLTMLIHMLKLGHSLVAVCVPPHVSLGVPAGSVGVIRSKTCMLPACGAQGGASTQEDDAANWKHSRPKARLLPLECQGQGLSARKAARR